MCDWQVTHTAGAEQVRGRRNKQKFPVDIRWASWRQWLCPIHHCLPMAHMSTHGHNQHYLSERKGGKWVFRGEFCQWRNYVCQLNIWQSYLQLGLSLFPLLSDNTKQINLKLDRFGLAQFQSSNTELTGCLHCTEAYSKAERAWQCEHVEDTALLMVGRKRWGERTEDQV